LVFSAIVLGGIFLLGKISLAANSLDVVINEVAWMGNANSTADEWLELYNNTTSTIDLTGWTLKFSTASSSINLSGTIGANGYFLLERTDDHSMPAIAADQIYTGALSNDGAVLELRDKDNNLIDMIDGSGGWFAGDNTSKKTMERINSALASEKDNWADSLLENGTPKAQNYGFNPPPTPPIPETPLNNNQNVGSSNGGGQSIYNPSDAVINEFVADPGPDKEEWIELYNNTDISIDLGGWQILDGSNAKTGLTGTISPGQFFIIEDPKGKLNNTGDLIILKDNGGKIIDQVVYGKWNDGNLSDNISAPGRANSLARNQDGLDTNNDKQDFSETIAPTKEASNIITSKETKKDDLTKKDNQATSSPSIFNIADIVINEFVADPAEDESEWLELYNNTSTIIELDGWTLEDGSKTVTKLSGLIASKQFLVIDDPKGKLNNPGDIIILKDSAAKIIDYVAYGKWNDGNILDNAPVAKKLFSMARKADGVNTGNNKNDFNITASTTKGLANIIKMAEEATASTVESQSENSENNAQAEPAKKSAITKSKTTANVINIELEKIRDLNIGDKVRTRGLVSVEPSVLGAQFFYLAGSVAGSGVQIYSYKKDFPGLKVGNYIEVTGELSESGGERRIKTASKNDLKILASSAKVIEPRQISLAEVGEEYEGSLVKIGGEVIEIKGSSIYLDDGSDEATIYLKQSAGLNVAGIKVGDRLAVIGIVSQTKTGYRILPRYQSDIEIIKGEVKGEQDKSQGVDKSGGQNNQFVNYLFAVIVFMAVIIIYLINKLRFKLN